MFQRIWEGIKARDNEGNKKYRYILLEGSSRSSKTQSLLQVFYCYANETENSRLSVWRDTAKDCRDTVMHDMHKVYPSLTRWQQVRFNISKSVFYFPTKTNIEICGTDDIDKVHGYQGDVIWLNEPYKISRATFDQLDMRTTDIVFIDWNPKQAHWIDDLKKDPRTLVIHSTFKDNPFCPPEQRIKILSYQPVSDCSIAEQINEHEAKKYDILLNELNFTEKQLKELSRCKENERIGTASQFNWHVYGRGLKAERPNRIFHWQQISLDEYNAIGTTVHSASDWGAVDPWAILDAKYYDGCLYLHERHYDSENILKPKLSLKELEMINSMEEGIVSWVFNRLGINKDRVIVCDPNRPTKIRALRAAGYDYSIAAQKPPGSVIDGISGLNNMKVCYTSCSENLKYEQENYSRQVDRYGIVLEEPEDVDNHLMDCARYIYAFLKSQGIIKTI